MKAKAILPNLLMVISLLVIVLDFYGIFFIRVSESGRINDVTFVSVLILGALLFFTGGLIGENTRGPQNNRWDESQRQASIRSAWYGIIACTVSFILLMLALVYSH